MYIIKIFPLSIKECCIFTAAKNLLCVKFRRESNQDVGVLNLMDESFILLIIAVCHLDDDFVTFQNRRPLFGQPRNRQLQILPLKSHRHSLHCRRRHWFKPGPNLIRLKSAYLGAQLHKIDRTRRLNKRLKALQDCALDSKSYLLSSVVPVDCRLFWKPQPCLK